MLDGLVLESLAFFFQQSAARENDITAALVELDNLEFELLPDELFKVPYGTKIDLRAGQEGFHTDIYGETTLHTGHDTTFNQLVIFYCDLETIPDLKLDRLVFGQLQETITGVDIFNIYFYFVAHGYGQHAIWEQELLSRGHTFGFITDVNQHAVFLQRDYISHNHVAYSESLVTAEFG